MRKKKAMVITAHPDDSFIFCHNLRQALGDWEWTDVVFTHSWDSARGKEFRLAAEVCNSKPVLIGQQDDPYERLRFDTGNVILLAQQMKEMDLIVTHNPNGEYGHAHHKQIHNWVMSIEGIDNVLVFAHNWQAADFTLTDQSKLQSPCLSIYEREAYIMYNFDLINEGFAMMKGSDALQQELASRAALYNAQHIQTEKQ